MKCRERFVKFLLYFEGNSSDGEENERNDWGYVKQ